MAHSLILSYGLDRKMDVLVRFFLPSLPSKSCGKYHNTHVFPVAGAMVGLLFL